MMLQGGRKVRYRFSILSKQTLFGNPFYEFKLCLMPEVNLYTKVAFAKRTPQPHPGPLEDAFNHYNTF